MPGHSSPFGHKPEVVFQPHGKALLPPLSSATKGPDVKAVLKTIYRKLGDAGKSAMQECLKQNGFDESSEAMDMLKTVFEEKASGSSKGAKKQK